MNVAATGTAAARTSTHTEKGAYQRARASGRWTGCRAMGTGACRDVTLLNRRMVSFKPPIADRGGGGRDHPARARMSDKDPYTIR
ncbi:hypothetical protein GCM10010251_58070 [Streptomyces aurantiogriseus]|uniref:Uncharacterized protein n=1 Tax=Streptomyces aurantiogriseus TaxID=66870 RepID=A0A918CNI5_9ACTN|nr:hypothetical protein GCM10010251_58070 [Streptomyces aurantiogriseus]